MISITTATDWINLIMYAIFYVAFGVLALLSLAGIVILASHGRSRIFSLLVCVVYIVIFLSMASLTYTSLKTLF